MTALPPIRDRNLLRQALTHRSYAHERPRDGEDNERLEFLGDAVLGFIVGEFLFDRYPYLSEAQLTRLRSLLVNERQLAYFARQIGVSEQMLLGRGAEQNHGRDNPSLLSDAFEALIGAYFRDAGIHAVREYLQPLIVAALDRLAPTPNTPRLEPLTDAKSRLQQWALAQYQQLPQYFLVGESGPDHAKQFALGVKINEKVLGIGRAHRKQEAEKLAAEAALKQLGIED